MVAKSVIEISVEDSQFREFNALFQKYQKQLGEMPESWQKVVGAIDDANDPMDHFSKSSKSSKEFLMISAIQADAISKGMARATGVQDKFNTKAADGAIQMGRMAKFSKEMHKSISGMSTILLKLGTAGVGGISAAIGAAYGATSTVSGQNLQGRSLGLPIGRTQAFDANFGTKYGVDSSILGSVQNMVGDPKAFGTFANAGIDPTTTQDQDVDKLTFDLYRKEVSQYRQWKASGQNAAMMSKIMFPNSPFSVQQLNAGAGRNDSELVKDWAKDQADAKKNAIDQGTADQASDVTASLKSNWAEVMNAFNGQLAQMSPELKIMGDAAAAAAVNLLKVAGPEAKKVLDALEGPPVSRDAAKQGGVVGGVATAGYWLRDKFATATDPLSGMVNAQLQTESSNGKHLLSRKGAMGPMQFMPDTWKEWGNGGDVNNLQDSKDAARRYDMFLSKRYGGDLRKVLAAYNWGMGNLDKDINGYTDRQGSFHQGHGADWEKYAPKETRDYVKNNVNIMITNSTTANVATSMNAAGH